MAKFATLDEYLSSLSPTAAATTRAAVQCVLDQFPDLTVRISWNVPQLQLGK